MMDLNQQQQQQQKQPQSRVNSKVQADEIELLERISKRNVNDHRRLEDERFLTNRRQKRKSKALNLTNATTDIGLKLNTLSSVFFIINFIVITHLAFNSWPLLVSAYYNSIPYTNQMSTSTSTSSPRVSSTHEHHHHLSHNQQPPSPPSQLFLSPSLTSQSASSSLLLPSARQISFVGGFGAKKRSDEEEDGFIMKTPAVTQADTTVTSLGLTTDLSNLSNSPKDEENTISTISSAPATITTTTQSNEEHNNDQPIAIDANRQQFLTHDQLSLLNASTKDEHIYLTNANQHDDDGTTSTLAGDQSGLFQESKLVPTSSRAGMSKVSHVSSFFSGKLLLFVCFCCCCSL